MWYSYSEPVPNNKKLPRTERPDNINPDEKCKMC